MITPVPDCPHYQRNCDKKAPCCGKFYPCRLCHDANYQGPNSDGCKTEIMDRYNVTVIRCRQCLCEQPPTNQCISCKIQFATYFCSICNLYEDDPKKDVYHCDECKMCRRGIKEQNFHCKVCGICLNKKNQDSHKCLDQIADTNCPICLKNLKISTTYIAQLPNCAHFIHTLCLNQLVKSNIRNCPICSIPIIEIEDYDLLAEAAKIIIPTHMQNLKVSYLCLDCRQTTNDICFNYYLKCSKCGSYNTKQ
ncbi:unnamed protein product (macronuclear) [Paramecium tetraurelia]|uniref:Uncharacterized protein n=1 Tax=Paramecium tetraurelia TaxID=5888 RepID=A0DJP8_PARTE|nr:uncharacterized protein GSPATT00017609001 [Paramecium tetraurelia]CAK83265.1 unnamed protein product [Paramecium tetraurelia]|eukprot:XP_001450662.1 hypothetical protein (macronuclear) [Paramecium tetraurelia strain d4-2]